MNLIEQLGGYERAKRIEKNIYGTGGRLIGYPSKDFDYNDDGGNVCDVELISFKANDLKKSLLEYRRERNIFEVGDCVVKTDPKIKHAHVRVVISTSPSGGAVLDYQGFPYKFPCVRHATDEEIAAGRRL